MPLCGRGAAYVLLCSLVVVIRFVQMGVAFLVLPGSLGGCGRSVLFSSRCSASAVAGVDSG